MDIEIKRTTPTFHKAKTYALQASEEVNEEKLEMEAPPRQALGDYCRRADYGHICLGFQPTIMVTFDIKKFVLTGLKENTFNEKVIIDPYGHLAKFYVTCSMCKSVGDITDDQVKLHFFLFFHYRSRKGLVAVHPKWTL